MPVTPQQFQKLKAAVEDATEQAQQAKGAYDQIVEQLKTEFGCTSMKEAVAKKEKLEQEATAAEKEYQDAYEEFVREWGNVLGIES